MSPHSILAKESRLAGVTGVGMAFVGGYVDVIGFVLLFGLFVAHATGNIVMLGVGLAGDAGGLATKLLALPVFIGAVAGAYALIRWRDNRGQPCEVLVLALQAVLLLVFMLLTVRALPAASPNAPPVMLAGLVGVAAMAVQNVGARVVFGPPVSQIHPHRIAEVFRRRAVCRHDPQPPEKGPHPVVDLVAEPLADADVILK